MIKDQIMKKQIKVGVQRNITDPNSQVESVPLLSVLEQMMTSENLKRLTDDVLNAPSKDERSRLKLKLPAVIISASACPVAILTETLGNNIHLSLSVGLTLC